jgi:aryl-alcohol dehydrogenase-like predicted oxidoreductase
MKRLTTISGAAVAPFAFGSMQFGGRASDADAADMFAAARAAGIAHFDSAWLYNDGAADRILGGLIGDARDDLYIATKVAMRGGAGRDNILRQFDESRGRLGLDTVDLLYLHRFDPDTPLLESFETLAALQAQGRIRQIGVSNFAAWQVMKAQGVAAQLGTRIDVVQPMYNLVKRQAEVEILPMCNDQGIVAVPYSPLGGGLLTGKYADGGTGRLTEDTKYAARYGDAAMHRAAQGLVQVAREVDAHPATLAVAWVAAHPFRPNPILSAKSVEQLAPSLAGLSYTMTGDLYARLSALYPAPPPATDRLEEVTG